MMTVFIVASKYPDNDATIKDNIAEQFPTDYYEIGRGQWLVAFNGTARGLHTKLIPEATVPSLPMGGIVVFGIGGYYGMASRDMWEWMATKLGG